MQLPRYCFSAFVPLMVLLAGCSTPPWPSHIHDEGLFQAAKSAQTDWKTYSGNSKAMYVAMQANVDAAKQYEEAAINDYVKNHTDALITALASGTMSWKAIEAQRVKIVSQVNAFRSGTALTLSHDAQADKAQFIGTIYLLNLVVSPPVQSLPTETMLMALAQDPNVTMPELQQIIATQDASTLPGNLTSALAKAIRTLPHNTLNSLSITAADADPLVIQKTHIKTFLKDANAGFNLDAIVKAEQNEVATAKAALTNWNQQVALSQAIVANWTKVGSSVKQTGASGVPFNVTAAKNTLAKVNATLEGIAVTYVDADGKTQTSNVSSLLATQVNSPGAAKTSIQTTISNYLSKLWPSPPGLQLTIANLWLSLAQSEQQRAALELARQQSKLAVISEAQTQLTVVDLLVGTGSEAQIVLASDATADKEGPIDEFEANGALKVSDPLHHTYAVNASRPGRARALLTKQNQELSGLSVSLPQPAPPPGTPLEKLDDVARLWNRLEDEYYKAKAAESDYRNAVARHDGARANSDYQDFNTEITQFGIDQNDFGQLAVQLGGANVNESQIRLQFAQNLRVLSRIAVAQAVVDREIFSTQVALARIDHSYSISLSNLNDQEYVAVVESGLDGLFQYQQGGLDSQDVNNFISFVQAVGVGVIAGRIH